MPDHFSDFDRSCMRRAVELAEQAENPSPNPRVGAVIADENNIIATGFHKGPGTSHAEQEALSQLTLNLKNLTLYVTLEPCCHTDKRTPPCAPKLLDFGFKRIVIGTKDPNPKVSGKGIEFLKQSKVSIEVGCLEKECQELICYYAHWQQTGRPYVILKSAMSLDGKVALANGASQWITGIESRKKAHALRAQVDAVLIGSGTALADDPRFTVRLVEGKNPLRIVWDRSLKLPSTLKLFNDQKTAPTLIVCNPSYAGISKQKELEQKGVQFLYGSFRTQELMEELGKRGIQSLMIEGGPALASCFVNEKQIDEFKLFVAPSFLGGSALSLLQALSINAMEERIRLQFTKTELLGPDLLISAHPQN